MEITRLDIKNKIFNEMKKMRFKPCKIVKQDGYFVWGMEEDSVTIFKIKGLRGWKFGMWITEQEKNDNENINDNEKSMKVEIFAQHKHNIDKFKPSASVLCFDFTVDDIENFKPYVKRQIKEMIKQMKKHPFISFYWDRHGYMRFITENCFVFYIKSLLEEYKEKFNIKKFYNDWFHISIIKLKLLICKNNKIIKQIKITDRNKDGWNFSTRWVVEVLFKENIDEDYEDKYLHKWFKNRRGIDNIQFNIHNESEKGEYYDYS